MTEIACLNHGYVALDAVFGDDQTPAICARTSYRNGRKPRSKEDDARLTRYLVKHRHTTPLEFCQIRYYMKMPISVARQLIRHRTASVNEISLRYVKATREFYVPEIDRCKKQSTTNKQGSSDELVDDPEWVRRCFFAIGNEAFDVYEALVNEGLSLEIARNVLPLGTYTEWYFQQDLHNLLHLFRLRRHEHAQYETRVYADAMLSLVREIFPSVIDAWENL